MNSFIRYIDICTKIATTIIAFLGLLLGYYYFQSRKLFETNMAAKEAKHDRLQCLLDCINKYDAVLDQIINFEFSNQIELERLRKRLQRSFEHVENWLELNDRFFQFGNQEVRALIAFNSPVDKCDLIMFATYEQVIESKDELNHTIINYIRLLQEARVICLRNDS